MGRKIEIKKISDNTKCQVTFSKRRSSLVKKADEISVTCDVDVLLVAFSPSGRVSSFCSQERIEDFLENYANLPVEKRLSHIKNVQSKMEKLQSLGNIRTEEAKLYYLNNQIENLEMKIKNHQIEVQVAEANLRDFELNPEQEASLHQLSWCERNLRQSYEKIKEIKKEKLAMETAGKMQLLYDSGDSLHFAGTSSDDQQQKQFEPWRNNQYTYPENVFKEMLGKGKGKEVAYAYGGGPAETMVMQNNLSYASAPTSYDMGQLGVSENLRGSSFNFWQSNMTYNAQPQSSCAINHSGIALVGPGNAAKELIYAPSQQDQSGKQAIIPYPQLGSTFTPNFDGESSNFSQNNHLSDHYLTACPQGNYTKATWADADNYWDMPTLLNEQNTGLNNMDIDVSNEGGHDSYNSKENEEAYNEMIVSQTPMDQAPHSKSGSSYAFFPSQDPLGDNAPWS